MVFGHFWQQFKNKKSSFDSLQQWWDIAKIEIQQLCRMYTLNVSRDISRSLKDLEKEIIEIQNLVESVRDRECVKILKDKKKILDDLLGVKAQGVALMEFLFWT